MKNRKNRLLTMVIVIVLAIMAFDIVPEYLAQHTYYQNMIAKGSHRGMMLSSIVIASVGVWVWGKTTKRRKKMLVILAVVCSFAIMHLSYKGSLTAVGVLGLVRKHVWIVGLIIMHLASIHAVGSFAWKRYMHMSRSVSHIVLQIAIGLVINIVMMYILLLIGGMYAGVVRAIYIFMAGLIYVQRSELTADYAFLTSAWTQYIPKRTGMRRARQVLLVVAIVYVLYGLQLAFIPYSTARDANHAYMFFPKIRADNHGLYWSEGPWTSPLIRYGYIAQWFSSMERLTPITGIARDTMAIIMNFVTSGIGILLVGSALLDVVAKWLTTDRKIARGFSLISGAMLLLWLTSGMGAFLVFVDNKTDLGVLLLVMVAMMSAFLFLCSLGEKKETQTMSPRRYAMMSGFFFGISFLAKPTAFIDIAGFVSVTIGTYLGVWGLAGMAALVIGSLAFMQIRSTGTYLEPSAARVSVGGVLLLPALRLSKKKHTRQWIRLLCLWGAILLFTVLLGKLPYLIVRSNDWSATQWINSILIGHETKSPIASQKMLADANSTNTDNSDKTYLLKNESIAKEQCTLEDRGVTIDELRSRQKSIIGGKNAEDNGRYVGYGQRTLTKQNSGIRYNLIKAVFRSDQGCYTPNSLAKKLCQGQSQLTNEKVIDIAKKLASEDQYIEDIYKKLLSGDMFRQDAVKVLDEYRRSRTIHTKKDTIKIPYRWIVPLNITFNRSLQNKSSYYTDIGFVWLPVLMIVLGGFIWSIIVQRKKIIALTGATLLVRCMWMIVADAIVWYGMGMILRTIIAASAVLMTRYVEASKNYNHKNVARVVIFLLVGYAGFQGTINILRISSQGAGGPFLSYKQGIAKTQEIVIEQNGVMGVQSVPKSIGQDDILSMQFPHYIPIIQKLEKRKDEDGVFIAGTYMQYFLRNQSAIQTDNLVTSLRKEMSDSDVCATYLRLRDTGYRTLVLDPNIATVVLGKGNESLKERLIMKEDSQGKRIDDGVMSMVSRLVMQGYAKIDFTNNIGIYYAYGLSSKELSPYMKSLGESDEVTFRTRMAMFRFLSRELASQYYQVVAQIFFKRFGSYEGMQDMGRIYGEELNQNARKTIQSTMTGKTNQDAFDVLTQGQKKAVYRYLALIIQAQRNQNQQIIQQQLSNMLKQSISSQSQIVSFTIQ